MSIKVVSSTFWDPEGLIKGIEQPNVKVVVYFFSVEFVRFEPHKAFKRAFPHAACIGASTMGAWCTTGAIEKGVVAMSLSSDEVEETFISLQEGAKEDPGLAAKKSIADLKRKIGYRTIFPNTYLGLVFVDGLCHGEEIIKHFTMEKNFNLNLVGGAAADEFAFDKTFVSADEKYSDDGLAVIIMKMKIPFYNNHYVHFVPTSTSFVITKSEPTKRIVWEIEGQDAAAFYAKTIGVSGPDKLNQYHFFNNPVGIVIGNTSYVRTTNSVIEGKGLFFYCSIEESTKMYIMKRGDIIASARKALEDVGRYIPKIQGAILFNCVVRYNEMQEDKKITEFNKIFEHLKFIGTNTYGEEYFTHHNQTLTAVFFGV